jgi:tetratricopeptide (TPR) repeat protein/TolB-like protein
MCRSAVLASAALAVLAAPALAQYDVPTTRPCGIQGARGAAAASLLPGPDPSDVAVFAFRSGVAGAESPYLGEGIAAGVTARLSAIGAVRIRSTVPLHRTEPPNRQDVLAAGLETGSHYMVAGDVRRTPSSVRAAVRIYRSPDGALVENLVFEDAADSLLALETRIAAVVAKRVTPSLTEADQRVLAAVPTRNALAYDRYLLATSLSAERTPESLARAVRVFDTVVTLDPKFAEAHARLAAAYAELLTRGWGPLGSPADRLLQAGFAAADRAISLDPRSATAWVARGRLLALSRPREPQRGWAAFERALALAPRRADVWQAYGRARLDAGELPEAESRLLTAAALDPDRSAARVDLAELSITRRDYVGACRALNAALTADPWDPYAYALRALVRIHLDETRDAWGDAETTVQLGRVVDGQAAMSVVDGHARDTVNARQRIKPYVPPRGVVNTRPLSAWEGRLLALAALASADTANAVAFLQRVRPISGPLWTALQDPGFDLLRADARFVRLAQAARPNSAVNPVSGVAASPPPKTTANGAGAPERAGRPARRESTRAASATGRGRPARGASGSEVAPGGNP